MNSHITARFRKRFEELPADVQRAAVVTYRLWRRDPFRASLHFKEISTGDLVGTHWAALAGPGPQEWG